MTLPCPFVAPICHPGLPEFDICKVSIRPARTLTQISVSDKDVDGTPLPTFEKRMAVQRPPLVGGRGQTVQPVDFIKIKGLLRDR